MGSLEVKAKYIFIGRVSAAMTWESRDREALGDEFDADTYCRQVIDNESGLSCALDKE